MNVRNLYSADNPSLSALEKRQLATEAALDLIAAYAAHDAGALPAHLDNLEQYVNKIQDVLNTTR
jgi:hypothetical protein